MIETDDFGHAFLRTDVDAVDCGSKVILPGAAFAHLLDTVQTYPLAAQGGLGNSAVGSTAQNATAKLAACGDLPN